MCHNPGGCSYDTDWVIHVLIEDYSYDIHPEDSAGSYSPWEAIDQMEVIKYCDGKGGVDEESPIHYLPFTVSSEVTILKPKSAPDNAIGIKVCRTETVTGACGDSSEKSIMTLSWGTKINVSVGCTCEPEDTCGQEYGGPGSGDYWVGPGQWGCSTHKRISLQCLDYVYDSE